MGKIQINFYQIKCEALESFYDWVNQGSEYTIAVGQSVYYDGYWTWDETKTIIVYITLATRFSRCGRPISEHLQKEFEFYISEAKGFNLREYGLTDEEIEVFNDELKEVETFLNCSSQGQSSFMEPLRTQPREVQRQKSERAGRKINFYKTQYEALETFYDWIDRGSAYDTAVDQSNDDWRERNEIERIILNITIVCTGWNLVRRFTERVQKELELYISGAKGFHLREYGLTDEEIEDFGEDLRFAEEILKRIHDKEHEKSEQA